jgi:putative FmdB family regulatory protein
MPIYEYACKDCGHVFDVLQKMSDDLLKDCPECGESSLKKLLSAPNFRLKGKGWYETDFKTDKQRNLAGDSGGKSSADGEKKSDKKGNGKAESAKSTDAKPAATKSDKASAATGKAGKGAD